MADENENTDTSGGPKPGAGDDTALLAELQAGAHEKEFGKPDDKAKKKAKPAAGEEDTETDVAADKEGAADEEKAEDEDEGDDKKPAAGDDEDEEEEEEKKDEDVELDATTKKRLAAVQRAEKRAKEQLAGERTKLETIVKEWEPKIAAAQKFEQMKARAKYAAADVLEELGLGPDDMEAAARDIYARSTKGSKDPKNRDSAARLQREREQAERLASTEKQLQELKQQLEEGKKATETQAAVDGYLDKVAKAAEKVEAAPLVKHMLASTPKKARGRLLEVANQLADELGEVPTAADVIAELERRRRQELEEDGIDPVKVLGISSSSGDPDKAKKGARTLGKTGGGSAPVGGQKQFKNRDEEFEDLKSEIAAGKVSVT